MVAAGLGGVRGGGAGVAAGTHWGAGKRHESFGSLDAICRPPAAGRAMAIVESARGAGATAVGRWARGGVFPDDLAACLFAGLLVVDAGGGAAVVDGWLRHVDAGKTLWIAREPALAGGGRVHALRI